MANEHFFTNLTVQPRYGIQKSVLRWTVKPEIAGADFYVYSSHEATPETWTLRNEDPITGTLEFEDTLLTIESKLVPTYYRILAELAGEEYDSPIIGTFDRLSRDQYRAVHKIVQMEYQDMVFGNGVRVFHLKPRTSGTPCPSMDEQTGQQFNGCPDPELDCYGTPWVGGFYPPVQSWVRFQELGPIRKLGDDGEVAESKDVGNCRLLAFPLPMPGDLIVQADTDDRYVIDDGVQPYLLRGVAVTAFTAKLLLLDRKDPRYRVPMPVWVPEPIRRL